MTRPTPPREPIAVTVFTGFLGAGKTSVILSLLPRLPKDYKVVLLKNEFGDVEVDSQLAKQSSLAAVSEILNGCMFVPGGSLIILAIIAHASLPRCCVLVGQMKTALLEIREKYRPDRIIIECSGSAFPATLAFQIRELERETHNDIKLDAILTVIDAENFAGYEDTSPTAKMQASYTDLIIINKWEHVSERALDLLVDHLNTLNDLTPKIRCEGRNGVDPSLIFGLDSKLFLAQEQTAPNHHDEVETVTVATRPIHTHAGHASSCSACADHNAGGDHKHEEGLSSDHDQAIATDKPLQRAALEAALSGLSKETVWRVKGFVHLDDGHHILNWAFGRYDLTSIPDADGAAVAGQVKFTVMGERGEVKRAARKFAEAIHAKLY
ncbi:hypothetical protein EIP91_008378 [Steccherinum ochraceum]|uniref:CobW/HypB/UreG nucleotide-binding domain-containing protein n=1 Tax=Steccherinum ochraceum TaxID=92696 RepID=A0A4R0R8N9_9APHY|nr:hypothetical protein EIP91_008378 [Steccherinum ochraceum]